MPDLAFTVFSGVSLILILLPLPMQWRARNIGTLLNIGWLFATTFIHFVNSILWWHSYEVFAHVWCDICVKVITGFTTGMAASSLCINRRLAGIANARSVVVGHKERRRDLVIDLVVGLGVPAAIMTMSYIFQPHRFDIMEGVGCEPAIWACVASLILIQLPPIILNIVSAGYGVYAVRFFISQRAQIKTVLKPSQNSLDLSHYFRLIGLATADIAFGLPISLYFLSLNLRVLQPWISWEVVHEDWGRVVTYSEAQVYPIAGSVVKHHLPRWLGPLLCAIFFLFCGVGDDAVKEYARWFRPLGRYLPNAWTLAPVYVIVVVLLGLC